MSKTTIWNDNIMPNNYQLYFDETDPIKPEVIKLVKWLQDDKSPNPYKWEFDIVDKGYIDLADENLQNQINEINEEIENDYCKLIETEIGFSTDFTFDGTYEVNFVITVNKGSLHVEIPMTGYGFKKGNHVRVNANRSGYAGNGVGSCVAIYNSDIGTLKVYAIVSRDVYNAEGNITWSLSDQTGIKVTDGELLGLTVENVSKSVNDDLDVYTLIRKNSDNITVSIETITPQVYRDKVASLDAEIERINKIFELRNVVNTYAELPTENVFNGDSYIVRQDENFDPPQTSIYVYVADTGEWEYISRLNIDIDLYLTEEESDERYATIIQKIFSDFPTNSVVAYQGTVEQCLSFLFYQFNDLNTRFNAFMTDANNDIQNLRNLINNIGQNGNVQYNDVNGSPVSELLNTTIQKIINSESSSIQNEIINDFDNWFPPSDRQIVKLTAPINALNQPYPASGSSYQGLFFRSTNNGFGNIVIIGTENGFSFTRTIIDNVWGEWKRLDNVESELIMTRETTNPTAFTLSTVGWPSGASYSGTPVVKTYVSGHNCRMVIDINLTFAESNFSSNFDIGTINAPYIPAFLGAGRTDWLVGIAYSVNVNTPPDPYISNPTVIARYASSANSVRLHFINNGVQSVQLNGTYQTTIILDYYIN